MLGVNILNKGIVITCSVGLILSIYALFVETKIEHDNDYVAMCDISEHMSCTKAFGSPYGKGFGILGKYFGEESPLNAPNSLIGIFFYTTVAFLSLFNCRQITKAVIALNILSNIGSVYLAYILYFILYDFCVICVSTYVVNLVNLILSIVKFKLLPKPKSD